MLFALCTHYALFIITENYTCIQLIASRKKSARVVMLASDEINKEKHKITYNTFKHQNWLGLDEFRLKCGSPCFGGRRFMHNFTSTQADSQHNFFPLQLLMSYDWNRKQETIFHIRRVREKTDYIVYETENFAELQSKFVRYCCKNALPMLSVSDEYVSVKCRVTVL